MKSPSNKCRVLLQSLLALAFILTNTTAFAQVWGRPLPAPPEMVTVPSGTLEAAYSVPKTFQLRWYQYLATPLGPVDPAQIVVCIQAPTVTCTLQANAPANGVWSGTATAPLFTRVAIRNAQKVLLGYAYSLTATLGNAFFDRPLKWTVGACSGVLNSTCTFTSAAKPNSATHYYSTKNIRPDRFSFVFWDGPLGQDLRQVSVTALAGNYGTTDVGPFRSEVIGMKALIDPNNMDLCETNPNRPGLNLPDTALLLTTDGRQLQVGNVRSGGVINTSGLTIAAISVDGPSLAFDNPTSFDVFLPVGEIEEPVAYHVVRVVAASAPIPAQGSRVGIVGIAATDFTGFTPWSDAAMNNRVVEFNEADNKRVRCTVMIW
jgi:hypothetical protein